ncbi:Holliday junction resolvase RuvX [Candidatus Collierbacteria bacterium]|nr:Holliday junction resolvase RuvX [Candidatus Collierbacteria bacterium]
MVYLCLDPGLKHTGVAISHEGILAQPLTTIRTADFDKLISQISSLYRKYQPDVLIIGQPETGPIKLFAKKIFQKLSETLDIKPNLFPEDLSTKKSQLQLRGFTTAGGRRHLRHQAAAAFILQEYLDSQSQ